MIELPGAPFGMRPGAPDSRLFMSEIEHLDKDWQARALTTYGALGANDLVIGAGYGIYAVDNMPRYPVTDWRDPAQVASLMQAVTFWITLGGTLTLVIAPDRFPWWLGDRDGWNIARIDADFGETYVRLLKTGRVRRLQLEWEQVAAVARMVALAAYAGSLVERAGLPAGSVDIEFHAPDGHMWPGLSEGDGDEKTQALAGFAAGINVIGYQYPIDQTDAQAIYDTRDGKRRVTGVWVDLGDGKQGNPWGNRTPILDKYGRPVRFTAKEWKAERFFKYQGVDQAELNRCATMLVRAGADESGDGIPEAA